MRWRFGWVIFAVACSDPPVGTGGSTESEGESSTTGPVDPVTSGMTMPTTTTTSSSTGETTDDDPTGDGTTACSMDEGPDPGVTECEAGCGPNPFDVEHISGINYAARRIDVLSPTCMGPVCPDPLTEGTYGAEPIGPCEQTLDALESVRGPSTYCKFAATSVAFGFEIGFTRPPARDSITIDRPRFDDPQTTEDYVWRAGIVQLEGPTTEFNGDWDPGIVSEPDFISNVRNLVCLENLEQLGIPYDPDDLASACAATYDDGGQAVPLRMRVDGVLRADRGELDSRYGSCSTPNGVDTCCSACDHELSVAVAKYGVDAGGAPRSPNSGTALTCNPNADRLDACREFAPHVDREREVKTFRYEWDGCVRDWRLPRYDKVRQTHPDDRPNGVEPTGSSCSQDDDCDSGQECVGTDAGGNACKSGGNCAQRRCIAEWFVQCRADPETVAAPSYCVDGRYRDSAAGACLATTAAFDGVGGMQPAGSRLAYCDTTTDNVYTLAECCQPALGDEAMCDPFFQSGVVPIARHDRDATLPDQTQCHCSDPDAQAPSCSEVIERSCAAPIGSGEDPGGASAPDEYALRGVERRGGVRYNAELEGFELLPAHTGNVERSRVEACAQDVGLIGRRNNADGWLANESFASPLNEDFDRAMCSDSTYVLTFAGPDDPEHVVSQSGATLGGKQRYVFETVEFLVVPGSGFPTDNLFVSTCAAFSLRFTNKADLSADNQRKLSIWRLEDQGGEWVPVQRIAGGRDCDPDATAGEVQLGAIPCLLVDVASAFVGEIVVGIDYERYGALLQPDERYRIVVPGLDASSEIADPELYVEAFHDACGMPLITGDLPEPEYVYEVTIDGDCP